MSVLPQTAHLCLYDLFELPLVTFCCFFIFLAADLKLIVLEDSAPNGVLRTEADR